jgi:hemerythrin-like domain-containing protein
VSRALDDDHRTNLDLLGRCEQAFRRVPRGGGAVDPELARLAAVLVRALEQEVNRHFDFEERELFSRLEAAGEGDIADLLIEEHAAIREVVFELLPHTREAAAGTIGTDGAQVLHRVVPELVERMVAHIQKETMALLPMLDDLLDEDTDRELAFGYASA